jgi:hypothetical protein
MVVFLFSGLVRQKAGCRGIGIISAFARHVKTGQAKMPVSAPGAAKQACT